MASVVVSTDKLRRNLKGAAIQASAEQSALRDVLEDHLYSRFQASQSGYKLGGTSANGASTQITTDNSDLMFEVWSQLLDLYDTCATSLSTSDQAEILAEMLYRLDSKPVTSYRNDFTAISL